MEQSDSERAVSVVLTVNLIAFWVDLQMTKTSKVATLMRAATNAFCPLRLFGLCVLRCLLGATPLRWAVVIVSRIFFSTNFSVPAWPASMKAQITSSPGWTIIEDSVEFPSPSQPALAPTDRPDTPRRSRPKPEEPKWKNLTLAELEEWLAAAKREEGITD